MIYPNGDTYKGEWSFNKRHGEGELNLVSKKTLFSGNFRDHWPNGRCKITLPCGSLYDGNVIKGVKEGRGTLINLERQVYEGDFLNENRHGTGVISV